MLRNIKSINVIKIIMVRDFLFKDNIKYKKIRNYNNLDNEGK